MRIDHIDQVLPSISGRQDFIHVRKDGYSVIDYVYTDKDSFADPIRLELRGIKFDDDGDIIARAFEKFFNVGEREQLHEIDFTQPHYVMDKLDGSMVHPAIVRGEVLYMTRMGHTEHAQTAQSRHWVPGVRDFLELGWVPIFEWTAPDNRIVVRYPESRLTLLAVRHMVTGKYLDRSRLPSVANDLGVPIVSTFGAVTHAPQFMAKAKELHDAEGYVIRFANGRAYKVKADEYLKQHRAKSDLDSEKKVLAVVLDRKEDDLSAALDPSDASILIDYASSVNAEINSLSQGVIGYAAEHSHLDRKSFAIGPAQEYDSRLRSALFAHLDGKDVRQVVCNIVSKYPEILQTRWER